MFFFLNCPLIEVRVLVERHQILSGKKNLITVKGAYEKEDKKYG
jgi:hypothetical protein